jgi:predicted transcriptional regulator
MKATKNRQGERNKMVSIVTKDVVYRYVMDHPHSTPLEIANALDAPISAVNKRLLKLMYSGSIDRKEIRPKLDSMYYFPISRSARIESFAY